MILSTSRTTIQDPADDQLGTLSERDDYGPPHPNTKVLPVETRPNEELRDGARRTFSRNRTGPPSYINESYFEDETTWEENEEELVVRGIIIIEQTKTTTKPASHLYITC